MQSAQPREKHLIIGVYANEPIALEAFRLLQQRGMSPENVAIVGKGYRDADAVGFADPVKVAKERAWKTAGFTGLLGLVFGFLFNWLTQIDIVPDNRVLSLIIAAILGGLSGLMGGVLVGGGTGLVFESGESIAYRNRIEKGKYLLLVEGNEVLVRTAEQALRSLSTAEALDRYYFRDLQPAADS
ncbi:hypothetical protein [Gloeobacter morelensis]|uniref:DUF1269 domain-containing protein n=1 Tax=Gloeobacter morelensis MG652769 TaxID=2781736 RepID=A0ABY3PS60_9CYAN|nr:hypothetical protein [Gloeobacter morelensis]UFP96359.1 hypothetical protein ISF26_09175 [Gloeobacter morelensis MG652769]